MAGLNHCRPSGRKQWAVRGDGGRTSLHGLRSQLAEDGCPDSQVVMAKKLLDVQSDTAADEESSRQGVYWLIKASEQGNEEATQILQHCLERGRGITELNFLDVKACLNMSQEEKLARRAARKMFVRLSAGEDFITSEQLLREIRRVREAFERLEGRYSLSLHHLAVRNAPSQGLTQKSVQGEKSNAHFKENGSAVTFEEQLEPPSDEDDHVNHHSEAPDWSSRVDPPGEKLSEEHLVSAAVMYAQGELPLVQQMLDLQHPSNPPAIQIFNPLTALVRAYTAMIKVLGRQDTSFHLPSLTTAIQIALALILYTLVESVEWSTVLPIAIYHGTFLLMIVFTCQMLNRRHEFQHFRVWSGLFLRYSGGSLNPDEAEYQYCRNNLKPYAHFFVALIINLMTYPLLVSHWTPHSELTVLSLCLTFLSLYYFLSSAPRPFEVQPPSGFTLPRKQLDVLVLFSFAVNVLAKYPYDLDLVVTQGWRFVDVRIPTFASYVVGHGIEFCLNFRGVFYLLMPAVFLKIAARDRWRGTYRVLIPHCVTLAWWQVAVLTAQGTTWYGLIRATLAVVGMVLFLPLAGLATVLLPLAAATRFIMSDPPREAMQVAATTLLAATPLLVACWLNGRRSPPGSLRSRLSKVAVWTEIVAAVVAVVLLLSPALSKLFVDTESVHGHSIADANAVSGVMEGGEIPLSWDQFHVLCHKPAWEQSSTAHVQRLCSQLDGVPVKWDGYVVNVHITRILNPWLDLIKRLPEPLGSLIACAVSSRLEEKHEEDHCSTVLYPDAVDQERCKFVSQHSSHAGKCSLTYWDSYEFEVEVKMNNGLWPSPSMSVFLLAEDPFRNMSFALRSGDHVWFKGLLSNDASDTKDSILGGSHPSIKVFEAGCINCRLDPPSVKLDQRKFTPYSLFGYVYCGTKFLLNCLLNPVVIFK